MSRELNQVLSIESKAFASECVSECVYMWCVCDYMGVCWSVFHTSLFVCVYFHESKEGNKLEITRN